MIVNRFVEYAFFFGFMAIVAYIVWEMMVPFVSALALSAIIVTICYPLYTAILKRTPKQNETLGALLTTVVVLFLVFIPLALLASAVVNEAVSIYNQANSGRVGFESTISGVQSSINQFFPGVELNATEYVKQTTSWLAGNVGAIFSGTASTIFLFFISLIGSFYLFRDGRLFTRQLIAISPLPDDQDELILRRMAIAVRSVATGTVLVALTQGLLTTLGLYIFGFQQVVLLGTIAAIGALVPGIGTTIIFIPAVLFLLFTGSYGAAIGLAVWGVLAVGLIDNLLGPHLMSRGNPLHPFIILLAVLGGISVFGPIGFIVGPVVVSLLKVLLELYQTHISDPKELKSFT